MPIDYSKYPKNWKLKSRFIRDVRAGGRCEECGAENHKPHPVTGSHVVLTVAHLFYAQDKTQFCDLDQLKAMCQRCHLFYDLPHHIAKRKANRQAAKKQYEFEFITNIKQS